MVSTTATTVGHIHNILPDAFVNIDFLVAGGDSVDNCLRAGLDNVSANLLLAVHLLLVEHLQHHVHILD